MNIKVESPRGEIKARGTSTAPEITRQQVNHLGTLADNLPPGELRDGVYALIRDWHNRNR